MFTGGKYAGEPIPSFTGLVAVYNDETAEDGTQIADHFSYLYGTPSIVSADPEDGGFNLPNDLTEFKFTFDHAVDVKALDAKLGKEKLTVTPAEGYSKNITLSRAAGALADGIYKLVLSNVKGDKDLGESGTYTLTLSFGPVTVDPTDQPRDILPLSYMNETQEGYIPVGFKVVVDGLEGEVRTSEGGAYSGGPRTFNFGEGGDFTKGLYTRNTYIEYGSIEGYELPLVADSKYKISFNTARWKASGQWFVFDIINPDGEVVKSWKIENNPDAEGLGSRKVTFCEGLYCIRRELHPRDFRQLYPEMVRHQRQRRNADRWLCGSSAGQRAGEVCAQCAWCRGTRTGERCFGCCQGFPRG